MGPPWKPHLLALHLCEGKNKGTEIAALAIALSEIHTYSRTSWSVWNMSHGYLSKDGWENECFIVGMGKGENDWVN